MTKIFNIAKNTSYLTSAMILQKIISFSYFTILARNLGPEYLGRYYFAISFTTIFAIFIDLGLINVLTREVAKYKDKANNLLGNVITIKLPFTLLSFLSVFIIMKALGYDELSRQLVYISSICMILDSFTATFFAVMRGFHILKFESIASFSFQIIVMTFGLLALYSGKNILWIMGALAIASISNFLYSSTVLKIKWNIKIIPKYNRELIKRILKITIPFGMFVVFQRIYMYLDSVLLSIMAGNIYVGLYQIAFKIVFALQFLPLAFTASLYPAMSSYWINDKKQLSVSFERAMNYLIIISLPIALGIATLADKIVLIFKSGYGEAVLPMQIIMGALLFIFLNFPIGSLLNACDRQKINTMNMGIAMFFSIILNLILIPMFQATGASITVLITNFLIFCLGIYWVPKIIEYNPKKTFIIFMKSLLSAIIMSLAVFYLKTIINIFIASFAGCFIYFLLLFLIGGFKREDVISIYNSFIKKSVDLEE